MLADGRRFFVRVVASNRLLRFKSALFLLGHSETLQIRLQLTTGEAKTEAF